MLTTQGDEEDGLAAWPAEDGIMEDGEVLQPWNVARMNGAVNIFNARNLQSVLRNPQTMEVGPMCLALVRVLR